MRPFDPGRDGELGRSFRLLLEAVPEGGSLSFTYLADGKSDSDSILGVLADLREKAGDMSVSLPEAIRAGDGIQCFQVLQTLRDILWPPDDPDRQWSSDEIADVAWVLETAGFGRPT